MLDVWSKPSTPQGEAGCWGSPSNCIAHCRGQGLWWEGVSAFQCSAFQYLFQCGYFLSHKYAQVSLNCFSGFLSEVLIHVWQFIESMDGGFLNFLSIQMLLQCTSLISSEHLETGFLKKTFFASSTSLVHLVHTYWLCRRYCAKCFGGNRDEPDMANDLKKLSIVGQTFEKKRSRSH